MADAWLNGSFIPEEQAGVSIADAGLLHAAGAFTTMRAAGGQVIRLDQHLARLRNSCSALHIPLPHGDDTLGAAATAILERNGLSEARLRLTVTRGRTTRDPLHGENFAGTCFLTGEALASYPAEFYQRGLTVVLQSEQKLNPYDIQAGHKTLDYLGRLAALREAARRGAGEALWFNVHNFLQSGSISNIFLIEEVEGRPALITPPTNQDLQETPVRRSCPYSRSNVLPGVTRAAIIDWARGQSLGVERVPVDVNRLLSAREVFLTNSIMGVMPVTRIEQHQLGEGIPGEWTQAAMMAEGAPSRSTDP